MRLNSAGLRSVTEVKTVRVVDAVVESLDLMEFQKTVHSRKARESAVAINKECIVSLFRAKPYGRRNVTLHGIPGVSCQDGSLQTGRRRRNC